MWWSKYDQIDNITEHSTNSFFLASSSYQKTLIIIYILFSNGMCIIYRIIKQKEKIDMQYAYCDFLKSSFKSNTLKLQ